MAAPQRLASGLRPCIRLASFESSHPTQPYSPHSPMGQPVTPMDDSTSSSIAANEPLPPFLSVTQFPRNPKPEQLQLLYPECLQALKDANQTRRILRVRMEAKKQLIASLHREIERAELELSPQAPSRVSLHQMTMRLYTALQEMETIGSELDQVVHEAHRVPRTQLGRLIEKLKALVHRWRAFRLSQRQKLAGAVDSDHDGDPA